MAGKIIDATLRFVDNFTKPMGAAIGKLEECGRTYQKVGKQIENAGKGIANTGSTMTKAITVPVLGLGMAAVKTAADFEAGMSKVQSISGATAEDIALLKEEAIRMGNITKFSCRESADALSYMAMAGWKTEEMLDGLEPIMYLAGATGEDLAMTSDIVTDGLTAFGMTADKTQTFVNVLARTASNANTDVYKMGETFKYVAPTAGALGYSIEDTAVAIGLMASGSVKASQAGTALNSWFTRMAKPTDESEAAMEKLGISLTNSEGNMKDLIQVITETREAFSDLTNAEKAEYAAKLAGKTGMAGLLNVVNATPEAFDKLTQSIANSNGAAKEMYEIANDNLNGRLTELKSKIEVISITFGERLMPYVEKGVGKLQELADRFNSLSDEQVDSIIKWAGIAAAVGPAVLVFGKAVVGIGKVVGTLGKFGTAVKAAGGIIPLLTGPVGIAVAVVGVLAAAGVLVYKNWDKVKTFFSGFGKNIVSVFNESGQTVGGFSEKIAGIKERFSGIIAGVKDIWEVAGPYVKKFGEAANDVFKVKLGAAIGFATGLLNSLINAAIGIVDAVTKTLGGLVEFLAGIFTGDIDRALKGFTDMWSGNFQILVELAKAPINGVIGVINGMVSQINKLGITVPEWSPWNPGKKFSINIPSLSYLYKGTDNWQGGPAMIHDRGAEIVDLPKGTRVYPHDKSLEMARQEGSRQIVINIPKIADKIIVREEADIDKIIDKIAECLEEIAPNMA